MAVFVEVDEAKAGVAALVIHEACSGRQGGSDRERLRGFEAGLHDFEVAAIIAIDQPDAVVRSVRPSQ